MATVKCSRSHYYDNEKYPSCPYCARMEQTGGVEEDSATVAMAFEGRQVEQYALAYMQQSAQSASRHISLHPDAEKTIGLYEKQGISGYIAGWLVCIEGNDYGRDFPLYAGFNRIGRGMGNDIVLQDPQVSRQEHCAVIYEEKKNVFYVVPQAGHLAYIGEELLDRAVEITSGQILTIGESRLELVAFCTGDKRWKKQG